MDFDFVELLGRRIELAAGTEGTKHQLSITFRIPVLKGLFLSGRMELEVSHTSDGYKVRANPALGLALGGPPKKGHAFVDLLTEFSIEAQAESGRRVMELLSLAMEAEVRAMRDEPPPILLWSILGSNRVTRRFVFRDLVRRSHNFIQGEGFISPFWSRQADIIWGLDNMAQVMAGMDESEYAQTVDQVTLEGEVEGGGKPSNVPKASISGEAGGAMRRRIERRGDDDTAVERRGAIFVFAFDVGLGFLDGAFELEVPLHGDRRGGSFKADVSAKGELPGSYGLHSLVSGLLQVIRIAMQRADSTDAAPFLPDEFSADELPSKTELIEFADEAEPELLQFADNQGWNILASAGVSDWGLKLSVELDFDTKEWKFSFIVVDDLSVSKSGQKAGFSRERTILEHPP